jgi:hypothetical protein
MEFDILWAHNFFLFFVLNTAVIVGMVFHFHESLQWCITADNIGGSRGHTQLPPPPHFIR